MSMIMLIFGAKIQIASNYEITVARFTRNVLINDPFKVIFNHCGAGQKRHNPIESMFHLWWPKYCSPNY